MAAETQEFFGPGIAVEVGQIQRELKKLWQQSEQAAARASRLNLVIYSAAEHSLRANTALVERIARQHACRAILIAAKPQMPGNQVRSWVNAHCQISKTGAKQRCSEQIAFQFEGEAADFAIIPNIVFSHLDSDLPLYLWWQGEFPAPAPDEGLMTWVDRLLFDSGGWSRPAEQFAVLKNICADNPRLETALGDLNWTRLTTLRQAIAQFFDPPAARESLLRMETVEIVHTPGARLSALMLAGWLAARLGWKLAGDAALSGIGQPIQFQPDGEGAGSVAVTLKEPADASGLSGICGVTLRAGGGAEFTINRQSGSNFFNTSVRAVAGEHAQLQVLPAGSDHLAELVSGELVHTGNHQTYLKVVAGLGSLLGR